MWLRGRDNTSPVVTAIIAHLIVTIGLVLPSTNIGIPLCGTLLFVSIEKTRSFGLDHFRFIHTSTRDYEYSSYLVRTSTHRTSLENKRIIRTNRESCILINYNHGFCIWVQVYMKFLSRYTMQHFIVMEGSLYKYNTTAFHNTVSNTIEHKIDRQEKWCKWQLHQ